MKHYEDLLFDTLTTSLIEYVEEQGWKHIKTNNTSVYVHSYPNIQNYEQINIPLNPDTENYTEMILDVVSTIAYLENYKNLSEVLQNVLWQQSSTIQSELYKILDM